MPVQDRSGQLSEEFKEDTMRKRRGGFWRKVLAVLLSAVLCVGIFAREGALGTYAAEDTQTARLRVKVETSSGTSTEFNGHAVLESEIGDVQVTVKGEVRGDEIIYEVPNLQRGVKYNWYLSRESGGSATFVCSVKESDEAIIEQEILLYPVEFYVGNRIWKTQYVPFNSTVSKPYPSPVLQDCTFLYWATSPITKEEYQFWLPKGPTSVYAIWKHNVTEDSLKKILLSTVSSLSISNSTTQEEVKSEVKKAIDAYFEIDSVVKITVFNFAYATSENKGTLYFVIFAGGEGVLIEESIFLNIPQLPPEQVRGWTLDETGSLTITSQAGMDDWVQNGRTEENLSAVKNIVIQEGVTVLPDHAFSGCGNLNSVSLPGTVTGIGSFAFAGDSSLSGVTLPPNLQAIGDGAFSGCGSLDQVIMQGSVPPSVGNSVFDGCKFVTDSASSGGIVVPPGSEDAYKTAGGVFEEYIKEEKPQITQEALDRKLQEIIGSLTVSNDTTQEEVRNAVKSAIDGYFRNDCVITIAEFGFLGNATADSEGALKLAVSATCGGYTAGAEGIIPIAKLPPLPDRGWSLDEAGNLTIDSQAGMDDWTSGGRAEGRFPGVKKILIQGGVTNIPSDAFSGCCDLGSIVIPDTVTSIGSLAFKHASSLAEITLPPHLQSIGDGAFSDCSSLEKLVMQGTTPPSLGTSVFDNCKFVENSSKGIVVPGGSEDAYKAAWGSLGANILEKHVHSYGAEWKSDENSHWHECSCGAKSDTAAHTWGEGTVTKEPTASEPGVMSYICSVCGMSKSESIPASGSGGGNGDGNEGGSGDGSGDGNGDGNEGGSGNGNGSGGGNGNGSGGGNGDGNGNGSGGGNGDGSGDGNGDGSGDGNGDGSGGGNGDGGGDGNPGGGTPSVSGNDHPGGGSVSGNDGPGDVTPSDPGDDHPGGENGGGGSPSVPESGNGDAPSGGGDSQPPTDNIDELALLWSTLTAEVPKDAEPRTADGVRLELYATVAMIAGFFYLLLLFLDRYDISEEKRRESLARLVRWAKCGGWPRRLPVMALLFVMRTYYRIADGQKVKKEKA